LASFLFGKGFLSSSLLFNLSDCQLVFISCPVFNIFQRKTPKVFYNQTFILSIFIYFLTSVLWTPLAYD
jgi:hypothetical protein